MENIPESVLNLIEECSFDELTDSNQKLVLLYMNEAEYNSLHRTALILRQSAPALPETNVKQKDELLTHFVTHHTKQSTVWSTPIQLWKAASIILLLGAGWLIHWQTYQQQKVSYITQLDTVYLEKEVSVKVHDTVYYKEEPGISYTSTTRSRPTKQTDQLHHTQPAEIQPEHKRRGISAKDDSLIQSFTFVTL
jgi:hypothetical protein